MQFDLRNLPFPKIEDYITVYGTLPYSFVQSFTDLETNFKTLDRENNFINFFTISFTVEVFHDEYSCLPSMFKPLISISNFDFKFLDIKFPILKFDFLNTDIYELYSWLSSLSYFINFGTEYEINETTTFYHYFFKIEVIKFEDYYHLKITNEFKQFFEKNTLEPILNGLSLFNKSMLFSLPNVFDYPSQYISYKNINSSFKYFYFVDKHYSVVYIYSSDRVSYDTNITKLKILNFDFVQTFHFSFFDLTFGEYAPTAYSKRFIKHILEIVTPNKTYIYNTREFYDNNRFLEFETFALFVNETFILCIDKLNFLTKSYSQIDYLNLLNKSIETVFKLPSTITSKNSLVSLSPTFSKFQDNQIVKVKGFNQTFEVLFSFLAYSINQKEIFYFLRNEETFFISKEEYIYEI